MIHGSPLKVDGYISMFFPPFSTKGNWINFVTSCLLPRRSPPRMGTAFKEKNLLSIGKGETELLLLNVYPFT